MSNDEMTKFLEALDRLFALAKAVADKYPALGPPRFFKGDSNKSFLHG